jgi:hypothetical protein
MKTLKKRIRSLILKFLLPLKKYVNKTTYFRVTTVKSLQIFTENSLKKKKEAFSLTLSRSCNCCRNAEDRLCNV